MPDNEIKIRLTAEDAGVARVMRQLQSEAEGFRKKISSDVYGPVVKPRFGLDEQIVRNEMARTIKKLRDQAAREKIEFRAKVIVDEAQKRLFGDAPGRGPIRDISGRSAEEQEIRNIQAYALREQRRGRLPDERSDGGHPSPRGGSGGGRGSSGAGGGGDDDGGGGKSRGGLSGFYKNIKDSTDGLEKFGKLVRGVGALGVVTEVGVKLQQLPAIVDEYNARIKLGATKTESFGLALADAIPVAGELAKGIMALEDAIVDAVTGIGATRRKQEEDQDNRDTRQKLQDRRNAKAGATIGAAAAAGAEARDQGSIAGLDGESRDRKQAEIDYERAKGRANLIRKSAGTLSKTEDQDRVRKEADDIEAAAKLTHDAKIGQIGEKARKDEADATRSHRDAMLQSEAESLQAEEDLAGQHFASRLDAIKERNRKERAEADKERDEEIYRLKQAGVAENDPRYGGARTRRDEQVAAADKRAANARRAAEQDEQRAALDAQRDFQSRMRDATASTAATNLRLAGKTTEAEQLERDRAYAKQLEEIRNRYDKEAREHADRIPELKKRAAEEINQAGDSYDAANAQARRQRINASRIDAASGFSGESRLLTGVLGATRDVASDPVADATQKTAQNTADANKTLQETKTSIDALTAVIQQFIAAGGNAPQVAARP